MFVVLMSIVAVSSGWAGATIPVAAENPAISVDEILFIPTPKMTSSALALRDVPKETLENISPALSPDHIHMLRVLKCRRIIETFYNHNGRANFRPHIKYFIWYHQQLERDYLAKGDARAKGFGETWWWSLVYGGANFGMTCYGIAPGNCAGPLDVKHKPLVLDPKANIRHHTQEMFGYYLKRGVRGIDLCKWVMYPARPHDWGGGRFRKTNEKHLKDIARAYRFGKL